MTKTLRKILAALVAGALAASSMIVMTSAETAATVLADSATTATGGYIYKATGCANNTVTINLANAQLEKVPSTKGTPTEPSNTLLSPTATTPDWNGNSTLVIPYNWGGIEKDDSATNGVHGYVPKTGADLSKLEIKIGGQVATYSGRERSWADYSTGVLVTDTDALVQKNSQKAKMLAAGGVNLVINFDTSLNGKILKYVDNTSSTAKTATITNGVVTIKNDYIAIDEELTWDTLTIQNNTDTNGATLSALQTGLFSATFEYYDVLPDPDTEEPTLEPTEEPTEEPTDEEEPSEEEPTDEEEPSEEPSEEPTDEPTEITTDEGGTEGEGGAGGEDENPPMGVVVAVIPTIVAAAAAVISKKRK